MPSKSKAQRAFLIKVVADEEFAKSRKMSQDVARGILDEDEEHIAKDKHWADKLPDRASGASMESRGENWWDREYIDLIVEQQVHPSFESLSDKFKAMFDKMRGKKTAPAGSSPVQETVNYDIFDASKHKLVAKTGTADFTAVVSLLRMKSAPQPFWNSVIKQVDDYTRQFTKYIKDVFDYCAKCEKIYKKCETMQPAAALAYATAEMKKLGLSAPAKPQFTLADFEYTVGQYGDTHGVLSPITPVRIMVEYPTDAQVRKLQELGSKLLEFDLFDFYGWCLDDTDEAKWWNHHFPMDDNDWGPMLNLFPCAGNINGYDSQIADVSQETVLKGLVKTIGMVAAPQSAE